MNRSSACWLCMQRASFQSSLSWQDGVRVNTWSSTGGATLVAERKNRTFTSLPSSRRPGSSVAGAQGVPVPLFAAPGRDSGREAPRGTARRRAGIAIDGAYHPISAFESSQRLFCLSLPFLLGQHPFAQGITSSAEMSEVVADAIQSAETTNPTGNTGEIPLKATADGPPAGQIA